MRWAELDQTRGAWVLPRERTKNGRLHEVPLSGPVLAVLAGVPRRPGRELVFGMGRGAFSGWSRCKVRLDQRIAVARGAPLASWVLHDLRRTVATGMQRLGVNRALTRRGISDAAQARG